METATFGEAIKYVCFNGQAYLLTQWGYSGGQSKIDSVEKCGTNRVVTYILPHYDVDLREENK